MTDETIPPRPPTARWEGSGPSPDDPPWAKRRSTTTDGEPGAPASEDTSDDEEATSEHEDLPAEPQAGPTRAELATIDPRLLPPRPPKRTGVFVDADDLRIHVGELLRAFLGGYQVDAWGNFTFTHESARVFVTVGPTPIGPQVGVFSITNVGLQLTEELARFLLTTNHRLGFGSFSWDPDNGAVWLRHSLLGTTLDGPELQSAVAAVASAAAHFDEVIRDRFGGRTFLEAPPDVQDHAKPPPPSEQNQYPSAGGYL